jgi:rhamnose utilization protein RhaD (predicted bifunctional aldolase and dehydrogenase)
VELDPLPRVLLIEGVGLVTCGATYKEASIAADIYEHTVETIYGNTYHLFW